MLDNLKQLNWEKMQGLIPAIVQDAETYQVLMLGYMNQEALEQTLTTKLVTFYSRQKKRLWVKGETSHNTLTCIAIQADCDQDCLLILAKPHGNTCHLGQNNCFGTSAQTAWGFLDQLTLLINNRKFNHQNESYVANLMQAGNQRIAKKVGEEAVEVVIAAMENQLSDFKNEVADLLFHCLILLSAKNVSCQDIIKILKERHTAASDDHVKTAS